MTRTLDRETRAAAPRPPRVRRRNQRPLSALFGAIEAAAIVAAGVVVPMVLYTILWGAVFGFTGGLGEVWRAAWTTWLLGHGVDVRFTVDAATAAALGLPGAEQPVTIGIALLGFALATFLLGWRAGRRIASTPHPWLTLAVALIVFEALAAGLTTLDLAEYARPSLVQAAILPLLVAATGIAVGLLPRLRTPGWLGLLDRIPEETRLAVREAARMGAATVAGIVAVAGAAVAVLLFAGYATVIALYEALHTEALGGIALTLAQLAILPNVVLWAASWLVGPGFALGAGSHISPLGTAVGPVPAIPVLGAIPTGELPYAYVGLLVPALIALIVGAVGRRRAESELGELDPPLFAALAGGAGLAGGVLLGILAWASAGAAGPGRLAEVGPNPWLVGGLGGLEIAVFAAIGMLIARPSARSARSGTGSSGK